MAFFCVKIIQNLSLLQIRKRSEEFFVSIFVQKNFQNKFSFARKRAKLSKYVCATQDQRQRGYRAADSKFEKKFWDSERPDQKI